MEQCFQLGRLKLPPFPYSFLSFAHQIWAYLLFQVESIVPSIVSRTPNCPIGWLPRQAGPDALLGVSTLGVECGIWRTNFDLFPKFMQHPPMNLKLNLGFNRIWIPVLHTKYYPRIQCMTSTRKLPRRWRKLHVQGLAVHELREGSFCIAEFGVDMH